MKKETLKLLKHLMAKKMPAILKIQSYVLSEIRKFFTKKSFLELPPVIISPLTDPLSHGVWEARIKYEGQCLQLTKSMIFHKQLSLISPEIKKIFIISPNIRLEKSKEAKSRHLLEFQQVDFEIKNGTKKEVYKLIELLLIDLITKIRKHCSKELKLLKRQLPKISRPFPRFKTYDLEKKYGSRFQEIMSKKMKTPFWLESFYREFYDKEDARHPERFINYDLIYPEGFEEGLSGAEREYEYEIIVRKMKERKMKFDNYKLYLDLARHKKIPPTAGAGFGIQRLMRYLTGIHKIEDVVLFPRSPREKIIF